MPELIERQLNARHFKFYRYYIQAALITLIRRARTQSGQRL